MHVIPNVVITGDLFIRVVSGSVNVTEPPQK
jgi:hypothetical protein